MSTSLIRELIESIENLLSYQSDAPYTIQFNAALAAHKAREALEDMKRVKRK